MKLINSVLCQLFPVDQVAPDIYVGTKYVALNPEWLTRRGIRNVITILPDAMPGGLYQQLGIQHWQWRLNDHPDAPISAVFPHLPLICQGPTLIHCHMGRSRSVTAAAALLMHRYSIPADVAIRHIQQRRWLANPNPGFVAALHLWEGANFP